MYNVLLVDDEPIVKIALRSLLAWENHGFYICATASNGKEALDMAEQYNPHIIITDLKMPELDGIEMIKTLKEGDYKGEILVLSNFEDFEYVRNALLLGAVDYILKVKINAEVLLEQLDRCKEKLQNKNIISDYREEDRIVKRRLLETFFISGQSLPDFLDKHKSYEFDFMKQPCSICAISFKHCFTASKENKPNSDAAIQNTVLDALQGQPDAQLLKTGKHELLVVLPHKGQKLGESTLHQLVQKLSNRFAIYQSLSPMLLHYWDIPDFEQARSIYIKFESLQQFVFYEDLFLFNANAIQPVHYLNFVQYKEFAGELLDNRCKHPDINISLVTALIERCRNEYIYPEILKMFMIKVMYHLEFLGANIPLQDHEFFMELKESTRFCTTKSELLANIQLALRTLFHPGSLEAEKNNISYKSEIDLAIDYIQRNYTYKITLNSIASSVNLSPSYLCRTFKSQVGTTITNYINELRMQKAKELLLSNACTVKEISIRVGIDDPLYFSRLFKKYYGLPPSEYKY